jgi:hypothetical protein
MQKDLAWMEKYRVWREQQIAASTSSKRRRPTGEATVSAEELSSAVGRLTLRQVDVTGNGSGEVACLTCKKNASALSVRTSLLA